MKKGFTLVELLGTITILGVIVLIAFPIAKNIINDSKEELYEVQISNISDALKNWASDNSRLLPENEGETITITLGQLKAGGYIDSEIKNPINNKCFGNDMLLTVTRHQKNYIYNVIEETNTATDSCDEYLKPYIILNGDAIVYVEVGSEYEELGASAVGIDGTPISDNIIVSMDGTIDNSVVGNSYTITYAITEGNTTTSINRKVIVNDTIPPELTIPDNVILEDIEENFDIMEGVIATDNSGETINTVAKSNISFGIPGQYVITYIATDSSGNEITKKRIVEIMKDNSKKLFELAVDYDFDGDGINEVIKDECRNNKTEGACSAGTTFAIEVNDTQTYKFYVVEDNGNEVTLIMDKNIGEKVAWYKDGFSSDYGPITALNYLNEQTKSWNNIPGAKNYIYENNKNGTKKIYGYQKLEIENGKGKLTGSNGQTTTEITGESKARLLTYEEYDNVSINNSNSIPSWLHSNLINENTIENSYGYWLLSATPSYYGKCYAVTIDGNTLIYGVINNSVSLGIRPVITLSK